MIGFHRQLHIERPLTIAGAARARGVTLNHRDLLAALSQRCRYAAARHARANYNHVLCIAVGREREPGRRVAPRICGRCFYTAR